MECFKYEAELASFSENMLPIAIEYLERVRVRAEGAQTISVGLVRSGQNWTWLDGQVYHGILNSETSKARLVWSNGKWDLKSAEVYLYHSYEEVRSDLYFCQKLRGENITITIITATLITTTMIICITVTIITTVTIEITITAILLLTTFTNLSENVGTRLVFDHLHLMSNDIWSCVVVPYHQYQ